ncbi:signal protein [Kitasatospora aburaviensis]|uniref:Signal protein n=1 Tax=Kitasatospora aburaviensis TaxID=67265 RepID=A0ABW1F913_9ACTN
MRAVRTPALIAAAVALLGACSGTPDQGPSAGPSTSPAARGGAGFGDSAGKPSPTPTKVDVRALSPAELQNRWWSWAGSTETARNPVVDTDGRHCAEGQRDGVWLLAGTFGTTTTRRCTVPADTPILFPVVNSYGTSTNCLTFMDAAQGSAVLDGRNLTVEALGATQIRPERVENGPVAEHRGYENSWACGLWVRLDGLAPGPHEIVFRGSSGDFATGVDYQLTVTDGPLPGPSVTPAALTGA